MLALYSIHLRVVLLRSSADTFMIIIDDQEGACNNHGRKTCTSRRTCAAASWLGGCGCIGGFFDFGDCTMVRDGWAGACGEIATPSPATMTGEPSSTWGRSAAMTKQSNARTVRGALLHCQHAEPAAPYR